MLHLPSLPGLIYNKLYLIFSLIFFIYELVREEDLYFGGLFCNIDRNKIILSNSLLILRSKKVT